MDHGVFAFPCATDGQVNSCSPTQDVVYDVANSSIAVTCNNVFVHGLIVDAIIDGAQNGNGNKDINQGGLCNKADNFSLDLKSRKFSWMCGQKTVSCFAMIDSNYDLGQTKFSMNCTDTDWRIYLNGYEEDPEAL